MDIQRDRVMKRRTDGRIDRNGYNDRQMWMDGRADRKKDE